MSKTCSKWNKKCSRTKIAPNGSKSVREQKMFQMEQKMCKERKNVHISQNEVHKRPMRAKCYLL